jgi:hypothetical protein
MGGANVMKSSKETMRSAREAFRELDEITGNAPVSDAPAAPAKTGGSVGVVTPGGTTQLNLLPVDNEAYKAKRDSALQKPGAVIGQVTVPM